MILVDTNVLLRAAQPSHPHCAAAIAAVKSARLRGYIPCIVPQVIYEYWVVATRSVADNGLGLTIAEAETDTAQLLDQFQLFRDERAIFDHWRQIVVQHDVHGKSAHDARLVAAMNRHGLAYLLTFNDADFKRFTEITALHPAKIASLPAQ
jgi:predicted nucleic acid-binding protein